MPATVVVGTQWGDEGKGRFTDLLARDLPHDVQLDPRQREGLTDAVVQILGDPATLALLGESGLELFSDERLFTLFAAFNALGYDAGPVARQEPGSMPARSPPRWRRMRRKAMRL